MQGASKERWSVLMPPQEKMEGVRDVGVFPIFSSLSTLSYETLSLGGKGILR